MERDLKKYIKEYDKNFSGGGNRGKFYFSDFRQIREMTGRGNGQDTIFRTIDLALRAGFMVGYKCAYREIRKKAKEED